ncbi:protein SOB FIVE-LIKE 2 [Malania oleifera]|uniref:protein SOB FIVE-LIKE 2 n=1 Tax=Malania oleifera TaxID=397392 RepID=UPI0025ADB9AA|nr:protein SOB FIVE-LIKE 2 [Malania oleifera]
MDYSSEICGDAEECHSNESGWTMYIGSPMHDGGGDDDHDHDHDNDDQQSDQSGDEEDDDNNNGDYDDEYDDRGNDHDSVDSDDSMASDASSGPSHREVLHGNTGQNSSTSYGLVYEKGGCEGGERGRGRERKKEGGEGSAGVLAKTKRAITSVQSGAKARNNSWIGRRN